MEKEIKFKTKLLLALSSHTQKILMFKCHEQRHNKYTNQTLKPCLKIFCLHIILHTYRCQKSLKIPKRSSEFVYQRRTDNTMATRKKYKRTNNDLQNINRLNSTNPLKTGVELRCSGRVSSSCFTTDTRRVNLVTNR